MNKNKYLEYYMDSKIYSKEEVQKSIDNTKKEFSSKKVNVQVYLNEFGVYIITFEFNNKNSFFKNIFLKFKSKRKNILLLTEKSKTKINNDLYKINGNVNHTVKDRRTKQDKLQKRFEKYYGNKYGKYKSTGIYRPY